MRYTFCHPIWIYLINFYIYGNRSKGCCKESGVLIAKAVGVTLETVAKVFFRVREKNIRESFAKVGYY